MKILLVEDSRTSVLMVRSLLDEDPHEHYELTVAQTVEEAKTQLSAADFDLILLDLTLPDSSGLETVDSVYAVSKGTGIVVLTSNSDEKVGLAALKHGAQDFLVKDETYRRVLLRAVKYAHQRVVSEREIREARDLAEFATRSKSSFIANLSHELRTPLNAVIGFSELMLNGISGELAAKQLEYVQDIHKSGQYLHGLIGTVLDLSKIEADRLEVKDGRVNMGEVISDVVELVQGAFRNDKIKFCFNVAPSLPPMRADHTMIEQIVTNLVSNAVKYSPEGGRVTVGATLNPIGNMLVTVADQGIGIPKDQIEQVLQPFERTHESRARKIEGTGLGLPLAKGLVEAHGGTILIESELGEGTLVTVSFPSERLC
ncbi:ATP-binding response regulator [Magnetovibrio blakemorei]|uniref:histidine kinase n=1 Tax=Magnetovibrio blakemorei TaxID=28181 RepID=A0A1E5Q629_9PROT|nr:hybrid sensor histidine kinase/response regulator [Magnetovibrio blakemorei]OEJ66200.1 hypothetical protein BEN30_12455 [Magnetovibrio blakemorei]